MPGSMLPGPMLPGPMLPSRALLLISEYSKPLTRVDWRQSKPIITTYQMYLKLKYLIDIEFTEKELLHYRVLCNIIRTDWYYAYTYVSKYGLSMYTRHSVSKHLLKMDGIEDADYSHYTNENRYIEYD